MSELSFAIVTLGCKVNAYESEAYEELLLLAGFRKAAGGPADIYVVNTCAVTNVAAAKCRQRIHALHRDHPAALIAAIGCYVQIAKADLRPFADCQVLIGSHDKSKLVPAIQAALQDRSRHIEVAGAAPQEVESPVIREFPQRRAYLKVQDGCSQYCAYCIIPYARGPERSLAADQVIEQARELVNPAHRELVLAGIHTGRYHDGRLDLTGLLKRLLSEVPGLMRLRLSSIEMNEVTPELISLMGAEPRLARHLHIPLQAATDEILSAMGRPYRLKEYAAKIAAVRAALPLVSVSSDIIAGFPGETERLFEQGRENIRALRLSFLHVFPYSIRQGTKAAGMPDQIDQAEKHRRSAELTKLSRSMYNDYKEQRLGTPARLYIESGLGQGWFGHSSDYLPVICPASADLLGQFVDVRLERILPDGRLQGERTVSK